MINVKYILKTWLSMNYSLFLHRVTQSKQVAGMVALTYKLLYSLT